MDIFERIDLRPIEDKDLWELIFCRLKDPSDEDIMHYGMTSEYFVGKVSFEDYNINPNDWPDNQRPDIHQWFLTRNYEEGEKVWVVIGQAKDREDFVIPNTYFVKCVGKITHKRDNKGAE